MNSPFMKRKFQRISCDNIKLGEVVHKGTKVHEAIWTLPESGKEVKVAVKIMDALREKSLDIICPVSHNNILKFYGAVLECGIPPWNGIVTEFCSEGSLYEVLHDHEKYVVIEFKEKQEWARGIAKGMTYLHESVLSDDRAIKHNNLTSAHVYMKKVKQSLVPKIGGFGYSKVHSTTGSVHNTKTGTVAAHAWLAPERINEEGSTPKSDVYSFSIILWELYTRKIPYEGLPIFKVLAAVTSGKRPLEEVIPSDCPEDWEELIKECWAQDPEDRPSFGEIVYKLGYRTFHRQKSLEGGALKKSPLLVQQKASQLQTGPSWHVDESEISNPRDKCRSFHDKGRFGPVRHAVFKCKPVALKSLQPQLVKSDSFKRYMVIVMAVMGVSNTCPHLVEIIGGYIRNDTFPHIVMEMMETSLRDKLEKGVITNDGVYKKIALDVAEGLRYLHDITPPYVHGGLTSGNVLLSLEKCTDSTNKAAVTLEVGKRDGFIVDSTVEPDSKYLVLAKISDFCCSALHEEIGSSPNIPVYKAPEAGATKAYSTESQDVFAYGVLLLEMRLADVGISTFTRVKKDDVLSSFRKHLPDIPKIYELVQKCTELKPEDRPKMSEVIDIYFATA